jgi:hypothetical protein
MADYAVTMEVSSKIIGFATTPYQALITLSWSFDGSRKPFVTLP